MTSKTSSESPLFDAMDEQYCEELYRIAYIEGVRGYPFEPMMLNPYAMEYRWIFQMGFCKGFDKHKRNVLEDIVLNNPSS